MTCEVAPGFRDDEPWPKVLITLRRDVEFRHRLCTLKTIPPGNVCAELIQGLNITAERDEYFAEHESAAGGYCLPAFCDIINSRLQHRFTT